MLNGIYCDVLRISYFDCFFIMNFKLSYFLFITFIKNVGTNKKMKYRYDLIDEK